MSLIIFPGLGKEIIKNSSSHCGCKLCNKKVKSMKYYMCSKCNLYFFNVYDTSAKCPDCDVEMIRVRLKSNLTKAEKMRRKKYASFIPVGTNCYKLWHCNFCNSDF